MTLLKTLASLFAGGVACLAMLVCVASGITYGTSDPDERHDALITGFWSLITIALCAAAILTLAGCMSAKELACLARDNTSNPCN